MGNFNRSFGNRDRKREMHKAVCSDCGIDCEVPFEPTGDKPVYCSDCFQKNNERSGRFQDRGSRRPSFDRRNSSRPQNNEALDSINKKLDRILDLLSSSDKPKKEAAKPEKKTTTKKKTAPKKTKTSKKEKTE